MDGVGSRIRPTIGVTGPDQGGAAAWYFTRLAVYLAGGRAVRITPETARSIEPLDGLILGGGADVDPKLYGQERAAVLPIEKLEKQADESWLLYVIELILLPLTWLARKLAACCVSDSQDAARDELEWKLLDGAVQRKIPVLGICRGSQLINVYFGGTLHQKLSGFYVEDPEVRTILPRKRIVLAEGTTMQRLLGEHPRRVNALHRQAIDRLGEHLRIAARDRNGIVQGIEHAALPFALGVQWHPEYLPQLPEQRALFSALVERAHQREAAPEPPLPQSLSAKSM